MRDAELFQIYEGLADPAARDRGRSSPRSGGAEAFSHVSLEIDLSGRVAFVTGGSRGLGRADALTLAGAGADVVVADILVESDERRPSGRLARRRPGARDDRGDGERSASRRLSLALKCDVTDEEQVEAAAAKRSRSSARSTSSSTTRARSTISGSSSTSRPSCGSATSGST